MATLTGNQTRHGENTRTFTPAHWSKAFWLSGYATVGKVGTCHVRDVARVVTGWRARPPQLSTLSNMLKAKIKAAKLGVNIMNIVNIIFNIFNIIFNIFNIL